MNEHQISPPPMLPSHGRPGPPKPAKPWNQLSSREQSALRAKRAKWRREQHYEDFEAVAHWIRTIRKHRKLRQEDLARRLQVSRRTVIRWETGLAFPSIESRKKLRAMETEY